MEKIKHMMVDMDFDPRISIVILLVVVDMSLVYNMILGREWTDEIGVVINTRISIITFTYKKDIITLIRNLNSNIMFKKNKARRPSHMS